MSCGFAQDSEPQTNLEALRTLARGLAIKLSCESLAKSDSVRVSIEPKESAWYIENAFVEGLQSEGVFRSSSATTRLEIGMSDAGVEYAGINREGLFGSRVVERKVRLTLDSKIVRIIGGEERITTTTFSDIRNDLIQLSDVSQLENPTIPMTQGTLPREGLFSNLVEPIILIGSIAVAVLLLFNVRS